jgi:AraC family transcriptional regulator
MDQHAFRTTNTYRDQWLALLDKNGVGRPKALRVVEIPGGLVQTTIGEPPGRLRLDGAPANVLMFNLSPVQALRQKREGRSFVSDMLNGEMTLMPCGVPSEWSWNSTCDRMDVIVSADIFGDGSTLDAVDRFLFRDAEIEEICRRLYREVSLDGMADRLCIESLVMRLAMSVLRRHSRVSGATTIPPSSGLTRSQARRVLEYIETNLSREVTLREMAGIVDLSPYHFARMFKQSMSTAPHRYVLERRVERAKTMLRTTGASLIEIGLSTGFCDQSHFTSTFHRIVGATPTKFQGRSLGIRSRRFGSGFGQWDSK